MGRQKHFTMGIHSRDAICPECGKKYRGNPRTVMKLISLHMQVEHNININDVSSNREVIGVNTQSNCNNPMTTPITTEAQKKLSKLK